MFVFLSAILNNENDPSLANGRPPEGAGDAGVAVGANEIVTDGHQTIMIIAEEECSEEGEYNHTSTYSNNMATQEEELISPEVKNVINQMIKKFTFDCPLILAS